MLLRSLGLTVGLAAALSACSSAPHEPLEPHSAHRRDEYAPGRQSPQLFISPAGEPFRAPSDAPYPVVTWFAGADANHDGALSRDEFVADTLRFFVVLDADRNGVIDGFEVSAYENRIAPEILGGPAPEPMRPGPRGLGQGGDEQPRPRQRSANMLQGAALYGLIAEPQPVMASDGDFDRRITREEAARAAKARFALLDKDRDGLLRLAELPKTPSQVGLRPGRGGGALGSERGRGPIGANGRGGRPPG
ncbi:hypothetical protein CSW63_09215 [Caulobacter sp. FWC26]|nr:MULTISPECIES: hypothetical protein [unclassified Caulobacter]AZS20810.1 hypothetical protein CSW63_09215 [Caulobacter sp. FWC26]